MDKIGVILVRKPVGITSFDIIRKLRRVTKIRQIGHTGTLDPFAEGLMQILVGKATKIAQYLTVSDKVYQVEMKFGIKTDTGDITGQQIESQELANFDIDVEDLKKRAEAITCQVPPKYSAIKVNGTRAYKLARNNQEFELEARPVKISEFELLNIDFPYMTYKCRVSKGTYIRTLSEQIAEFYNTISTTTKLIRKSVDQHDISKAVLLDDLNEDNWQDYLLPIDYIMNNSVYDLTSDEYKYFYHGRQIATDNFTSSSNIILVKYENNVVGLASHTNNVLSPKKVFK